MTIILKRAVVFTALFLFGCSGDQLRINKAFELANQANYQTSIIHTSQFPIQIFYQNHSSKHAVIYLEGDGLVINRYGEVALNPTPTDPMAIRLAEVDRRPITKIVIHRPYHFLQSATAQSKYWTTARYAPEVIQSVFETIQICQRRLHFETMELVAYSGGACVALLLAPHLTNISQIISFAGNLDHKSWTTYHGTQSLYESADPMEKLEIIGKIYQIHFLGTSDSNTTIALGNAYKQRINSANVLIKPIDGYEHDSDWPQIWKKYLMAE